MGPIYGRRCHVSSSSIPFHGHAIPPYRTESGSSSLSRRHHRSFRMGSSSTTVARAPLSYTAKTYFDATYANGFVIYFRSTVPAYPPCPEPLSLSDVRQLCCRQPTFFPGDRRLYIVDPGAGSREPWLRPHIAYLEIYIVVMCSCRK